jgi:hypothetical protein
MSDTENVQGEIIQMLRSLSYLTSGLQVFTSGLVMELSNSNPDLLAGVVKRIEAMDLPDSPTMREARNAALAIAGKTHP